MKTLEEVRRMLVLNQKKILESFLKKLLELDVEGSTNGNFLYHIFCNPHKRGEFFYRSEFSKEGILNLTRYNKRENWNVWGISLKGNEKESIIMSKEDWNITGGELREDNPHGQYYLKFPLFNFFFNSEARIYVPAEVSLA